MKKILIVDDEKTARLLLADVLKAEGFAVVEAVDGREALEIMQSQPIDLVMTDRTMPGMDGLAFLKVLSERHSSVPVVMISGYGEEKLWGQALQLGAKDYLLKPFKTQDILNVVKRYLTGGNPKK